MEQKHHPFILITLEVLASKNANTVKKKNIIWP